MKIIKTGWEAFSKKAITSNVSDGQISDMEKIFYCGAAAVIEKLLIDTSAGDTQKNFIAMYDELNEYMESTFRTDSSS